MKRLFIILIGLTALSSCNSLLDEKPETFISPELFYKNMGEATSAIYAVYDILPSLYGGSAMTAFGDVASNSFKVTSASATDYQPFFLHSVGSINSLITSFWETSYRGIDRANTVIARVPAISGDENDKAELIGEAKFLRALFYFNLVRLFGDVPLKLDETTSLSNLKLKRTDKDEVYKQIVNDLNDAKASLPETPLESGRPSTHAARAYLATVDLTIQDYSDAAANALEVINSGKYKLWESYNDAFLEKNDNGKESLFAVQFKRDVDGNNLMGFSLPPVLNNYIAGSPVYDLMIVSDALLNSYETGDQRKDLNAVTSYVTSSGAVIHFEPMCFKYSDGIFKDKGTTYNDAYNSGVNYPILRYADVLLMYAEASNEGSGPTDDGYKAINRVRRRAFGADINTPSVHDLSGLDKDSFRQAVWLERFREFPFEANQWFDLVRTGRAEATLGISSEKTIYPIPQREIDVNDLLTQNPGYN